jgi:hypothetical protein
MVLHHYILSAACGICHKHEIREIFGDQLDSTPSDCYPVEAERSRSRLQQAAVVAGPSLFSDADVVCCI